MRSKAEIEKALVLMAGVRDAEASKGIAMMMQLQIDVLQWCLGAENDFQIYVMNTAASIERANRQ